MTADYNFTVPVEDLLEDAGGYDLPIDVDELVFKRQLKNGFFIEAGADDFETDSNSLLFEMRHNWSGLLVEPNPVSYPKGYSTNRKAWASPTCLATQPKPHMAIFSQKSVDGGMAGLVTEEGDQTYDIQCLPLYALLMAVENRTVNYLSLDVEGAEFLVSFQNFLILSCLQG